MVSRTRWLTSRICLVLVVACGAPFLHLAAQVVAQTQNQLQFPGGFIEKATSAEVRPRLTQFQLQAFLPPVRGKFTFPAPYKTEAIRITDVSDCVGSTDCVNYIGYSYWRNINNHVGSDTMLIFLSLKDNGGPTLLSYNKKTGETLKHGALFDGDTVTDVLAGVVTREKFSPGLSSREY